MSLPASGMAPASTPVPREAGSRGTRQPGAALPAISYERYPGAATAPFPGTYRRREPEKSVLHTVVREHLETFLEQARYLNGEGYPRFIEREFRRYLDCGLLSRGFARLRCPACGHERLVAFSCKGRLCPSCVGRRMGDIAAYLVDHLCARVAGFSLHAAQVVSGADRAALERLCRYGLRAPFSQQRLSLCSDGRVAYHLRRPWPHPLGTSWLLLEPLAFLKRLAALIPAPYAHTIRYHGIFANRSRWRAHLPTPPCPTSAQEVSSPPKDDPSTTPSEPRRRSRLSWAQLLRRVFFVDALACPKCALPMVVLALISDPSVVTKILRHLRMPTEPPPLAPARGYWDPQPGLPLPPADPIGGDDPELTQTDGEIIASMPPAPLSPLRGARPPP